MHVAANTGVTEDGKSVSYPRAPLQSELKLDANASFVHFTSNETIHGIQFASDPGDSFLDLAIRN